MENPAHLHGSPATAQHYGATNESRRNFSLYNSSFSLTNAHTPSTAFRHFPPNSARFSYATEGVLFISAQLSTNAVSAVRKVPVLIRLWMQPSAQART